ncbi:hypothetical protein [Bartonella rattaustraliani]|uniref:hypothetical protein n=1 Tax=Bartonella rattaustraliani TaxID=481139 RepID=UPI000366D1B2|nr:hypothetical protein [Bartonella rattaustraliani]
MFGSFKTFGHRATSHSFCHSHNSRPTHRNAYGFNDFTSEMSFQGLQAGAGLGLTGALSGTITRGPAGAFLGERGERFDNGIHRRCRWGLYRESS